MDVAAHGALPEHLPERMFRAETLVQQACSLERNSPSYAKFLAFHVAKIRLSERNTKEKS
jgi:hypothetical protein